MTFSDPPSDSIADPPANSSDDLCLPSQTPPVPSAFTQKFGAGDRGGQRLDLTLPDLLDLRISARELQQCCGLDPVEVWRSSQLKTVRSRLDFALQELLVAMILTPIPVGVIYLFIVRPALGDSLTAAIGCLLLVPLLIVGGRGWWRQRSTLKTLVLLLDAVDRYHMTLKAIAIADSLATTAGTSAQAQGDRRALLSALQLTRADLLRALTAERILRENQDLLQTETASFADGFTDSLTTIQALQLEVQAQEYQEFLHRAALIGASVRSEMQKLRHDD